MTLEEHLKRMIGELVMANAQLSAKVDELTAQLKAAQASPEEQPS
jgi:uncharacterized coiled-coil protein SlyX